ncbi:hypothetical protein EC991775_2177 [Escherichia coli 99.1775]|nr:hypothetical protein EC991775_2177 [Escherichia coli 99.1775]
MIDRHVIAVASDVPLNLDVALLDINDISVNWQGAAKTYSFDEVIVDSNGKKLDMRFGGNLTAAEEKKTGCLVCLDSCPVGIVSNATYTYGAVEKRGEVKFKGNASVLPANNTLATVTFKITE